MPNLKFYTFPLIAFLALVLATAYLASFPMQWELWSSASCMPDDCFCEFIRLSETVRQPANTWSSLAYAFFGLLVISHSYSLPNKKPFTHHFGLLMALMMITIGLGSAFYHASLSFLGQFADFFGMYLMSSFVLVYALYRRFSLPELQVILLYVGINVVLGLLLVYVPELRRSIFGILLIAALGLEIYYASSRKVTIQTRWFYMGLVIFAAAYAIWIIDDERILCSPESWLQGHALWHLLGAIANGMLYLYYRSEGQAYAHE
jgi:hypothetical protein